MISLDSETTGLDLRHGARPFFVTICKPGGEQMFWEWGVDPFTRNIIDPSPSKYKQPIPPEDLDEIWAEIEACDGIVLQNSKFDVTALNSLDSRFGRHWPWHKTYDTLIAGHLLASNRPHNLTDMAIQYLGWDISPYENKLRDACNQARRIARTQFPRWRIAEAALAEMPSAKETVWKFDTWLPRVLYQKMGLEALTERIEEDASYYNSILKDYANADSAVTLSLITVQIKEIKRRGLWEIFLERLKVLSVAFKIEDRGVTLSLDRLKTKQKEYKEESAKAEDVCLSIAKKFNHNLVMPKAGSNHSLTHFCFDKDKLNLPEVKWGKKSGAPSLDKEVMSTYQATLPDDSDQLKFVNALLAKRKRDTAISYMDSYKRFMIWIPLPGTSPDCKTGAGWYILHPSLNPTGTDTLRWSSTNPNEQNISKQEGFNLRYCFGPVPGREWWSFDAKNIELRLPAYEAGELALIDIFERPKDPPYFGSYHLAMFDALHPEKYAKDGKACKDIYESTWYQWTKNGNFAMIYGCQKEKADSTYRVPGAYEMIRNRFPKIAKLSDYQIQFAEKHGYIETIPDKNVNPKRGYPLLCTRTEFGKILPTVPLNYHIQGSACWWMGKAMVRVQDFFDYLNDGGEYLNCKWPGGYYIIMQVHDELVPDMPSGVGKGENPWDYNLPISKEVARLMATGGDDFGIPTPVGGEFHINNWSEGVVLF